MESFDQEDLINLPSTSSSHMDGITETGEVSISVESRQGRPSRGRKRKVEHQSRADRKKLYNTNKTHINSKGEIAEEKIFDENFVCRCSKKCTALITLELRKRLFKQFWSMGTLEGRCAIIVSCVTEKPKKQTYTKTPIKNRSMTRMYSIFGHDVCLNGFVGTLQISYSRIEVAMNKHLNCDSYEDGRGKTSGGRNAFPIPKMEEVRVHIDCFPRYVSHYTRNQTNSKFLSPDLNLAIIYRLYTIQRTSPVSNSFYKRVFYKDFNLRFKVPKKDTCLKCDIYQAKIKSASGADRLVLEEWHNDHVDKGDLLQLQMKRDLELAKNNSDLETLTFDLQKTLSVPKLPTNIVYYKRQLNLYNFGIHVGSSGQGIFNIWQENEASRGTQEVGSCLKKYIEKINKPIKKLILWSDSCGGQNRSIKLVLMLIHVLQNHQTLETISMRYVQSGHSFLPNDSEFGDAECLLKIQTKLYTDKDYMELMEACRIKNKFLINRMSPDDFFSVGKLEEKITNRKIDSNKQKINWFHTHEIVIEKSHPTILKMRSKVDDGPFQIVNIEKRGDDRDLKTVELEELWPMGRPLSNEKIQDLKEILEHGLIPDESKYFYDFLEVVQSREFDDDVDGFGELIDFDIEEEA